MAVPPHNDYYKETLHNTITKATEFEGLLPLLQHFPTDALKQFMHDHVDKMDTSIAKEMHFHSSSIDQIIPSDIINHIISFEGWPRYDFIIVNKQWYTLCKQMKNIYYLRMQKELDQNSPIPYDPSVNTTWLFNFGLGKVEQDLGYQRAPSLHEIEQGTKDYKPGDRVFVHPGQFIVMDEFWSGKHRSLSIIGAGCGVSFHRGPLTIFGQVYIQDITFHNHGQAYCIASGEQAKVWLKKCKFTFLHPF